MKRCFEITTALVVGGIFLIAAPSRSNAQQCIGDGNGDSSVTIDELVMAVDNALEGCSSSGGLVAVSGNVADAGSESFRVWAVGDTGTFRATEASPGTGAFTLLLPPGDSYVVGFGHYHGPDEMHFAGYMVFPCGPDDDDHFFIGPGEPGINLGIIVVNDDGSFARPQHGPPEQLDEDGDGVPDLEDPDYMCGDVGDHDHDGFYDDDQDHNGFHDDDMDHDGHHDDGHHHHGDGGDNHGMP